MSLDAAQNNRYLEKYFSKSTLSWIDDMTMQCQGVQLRLTKGLHKQASSNAVVSLFKAPLFVHGYLDSLREVHIDNMIEVGVRDGGSAIFFWNLLNPHKLCCIELNPEAPELAHYIAQEDLGDRLRAHFNVDQADRQRLSRLVDEEFADQSLDLVVDDASHLYAPSRATFEELFPRLRRGGLYILEDWKTGLLIRHRDGVTADAEPPLHQLVHELLELSLYKPGIVSSLRCYHHFVVIERGGDDLGPDTFSINALLQSMDAL